jgi:hypothetical protein
MPGTMNTTSNPAFPAQPLRKLLFSNEDESTYAVLDGASVPELLPKLAGMKDEWACLYRGELEPDIAQVAPYLVKLRAESPFTDWILSEGWGNHWGIFALTQIGLEALRRHFRHFLRVKDHSGKIFYFRFYDPRVLGFFLPTCNRSEIKTFYGPVLRYVIEDEQPGRAVVLANIGSKVNPVHENLA